MMTPIRKFKGDGTDTLYREAKLDEGLDYRYTIRRGDDLSATHVARALMEKGTQAIFQVLAALETADDSADDSDDENSTNEEEMS